MLFLFSSNRADRDFGLGQIDAVRDHVELAHNLFIVLVTFGEHSLHHLFPTVDHTNLHHLYPVFQETCKEFEVKYKPLRLSQLFKGQYQRLAKNEPNPLPPEKIINWICYNKMWTFTHSYCYCSSLPYMLFLCFIRDAYRVGGGTLRKFLLMGFIECCFLLQNNILSNKLQWFVVSCGKWHSGFFAVSFLQMLTHYIQVFYLSHPRFCPTDSEVFMEMIVQIVIFWFVTLCSLADGPHHFRGTCCLHAQCWNLQGQNMQVARKVVTQIHMRGNGNRTQSRSKE